MELQLPSFPDLPPHCHTTNGLQPHLMNTLKKALDTVKPEFFNFLDMLKPDLIIYDFLQPWVPTMASSLNIPAVLFLTPGAASSTYHFHERNKNPSVQYPFPEIFFRDHELRTNKELFDLPEKDAIDEKNGATRCFDRSSGIILIKTFRELEGKHIDFLSDLFMKKFVPVGPLVRAPEPDHEQYAEIIEWLDKKERCSTIFVSFGTECFLSDEEFEEMAIGLELSTVNFIWVVRFQTGHKKKKLIDAQPKRVIERVGNRGLVVENWAPQGRILGHSSIGGFVSHCGWSSVMESLNYGVPIIAMPMHYDQPLNARLVVEVGVGMEVLRDEEGNLDKEVMARTIKMVVLEKSGQRLRDKAKEFSQIIREKGEEDIDGVAEELVTLCKKTAWRSYT